MERNDPREPRSREADQANREPEAVDPGRSPDALRRLEERLDRASDAAEQLIAEAARSAARARRNAAKPPPSGWQAPDAEDPSWDRDEEDRSFAKRAAGEVELLVQFSQALRELIPPELQQRLAEALREVLLALRALIDWWIERIESRRAEPTEVQDIPIL